MSKTLDDVKLTVSGIGINSTRALLNSTENLSVAMTKINTYLNDLKSGAFTDAYTHPIYTGKPSGLYKITVTELGHVSDAIAVTGSDLPSHTHDYIPLTGSDNITGNLKINSAGKGLFLKDKNSNLYPGIVDNGTNLWIGSGATSSTHHVGNTYISAGYNSTSGTGNSTIFISVPNATNDGGTNYNVLHDGNTSFTQTVKSSDAGAYQIGTIKINGSDTILYGKDTDNDIKVNMIARGTTKAYLLGTTISPTATATGVTAVAETGVYFDTTAGELHATTFEGDLSGNVNHTNTDPTTAAGYGLTFHPDAGTTGTKALRTNDSVRVMLYNNATTGGYARLTLGNNTAATSGGKNGIIQLYGESAGRYCTLTCTGTKNLILDNDSQTGGTNFSPATTDTYDLGTTSLKWRNIYSNNVYGAFNGALTGNVNHTLTNPTTETTYGLTFHDDEGSTGTKELLTNNAVGAAIAHSTSGGSSIIISGNNTAAVSGGKYGGFRAYTSGTSYSQLYGNTSGTSTGLSFKTSTNNDGDYIAPYTTNKYDIGTSLYRWKNVYANTFIGDLTGDVTGDIKHTLTNSSTEGTYGLTFHSDVGTTGVKTLRTNDGITTTIKYSSSGGYSILNLGDATAAASGGKNGVIRLYGETASRYCTLTCTGTKNLILDNDSQTGGTNFSPAVTNTYDLGTSSLKWRNVYATTLNGSLDPSNLSSAVSVDKGGTGLTSITTNAFLTGYGVNAVRLVETKNGALYATNAGEVAQFGTLPVAQGGTGSTRLTSGEVLVGNGTGAIKTCAIATTATSGSTSLITSGGVYDAIGLDTAVTLTSSVGTVSKQAYYSAATKVCTFVLQLKLTSAISASSSTTTIATIGKHPKYVCPVVAIDGSNNGLVARVDNSGNIQLCKNAAISSGSTIRVSGSFPVA